MSMWEPFTEHARHDIVRAQEEAQQMGQGYIGPQHLLLAIAGDTRTDVARVLHAHGLTHEAVHEYVERTAPTGSPLPLQQEMVFTPDAKRVIELAFETAREFGHRYIAPAHLTVGIIRDTHAGTNALFDGLKVERTALIGDVLELLKRAPQRNPEERPVQTTVLDDADLPDVIHLLRSIFAIARRKGWDVNTLIQNALESDE